MIARFPNNMQDSGQQAAYIFYTRAGFNEHEEARTLCDGIGLPVTRQVEVI